MGLAMRWALYLQCAWEEPCYSVCEEADETGSAAGGDFEVEKPASRDLETAAEAPYRRFPKFGDRVFMLD